MGKLEIPVRPLPVQPACHYPKSKNIHIQWTIDFIMYGCCDQNDSMYDCMYVCLRPPVKKVIP